MSFIIPTIGNSMASIQINQLGCQQMNSVTQNYQMQSQYINILQQTSGAITGIANMQQFNKFKFKYNIDDIKLAIGMDSNEGTIVSINNPVLSNFWSIESITVFCNNIKKNKIVMLSHITDIPALDEIKKMKLYRLAFPLQHLSDFSII